MMFSIEKVDEINEDVENEKNRELFMNPYGFGPYGAPIHPLHQAAATTHTAALTGFSPYLSMAHINPWFANPTFFGLNPMYSQFLAWNYMMNPTTMMMNGMWSPYSMM